MMSEHAATITKQASITMSLGDLFTATAALIDTVPACDVRWKHVARAAEIHNKLLAMFESNKQSEVPHE